MKDIYELLRQKEQHISRLKIEVDALRVVAPLLSDDPEFDNKPTSSRSTAPSQAIRVSQAVNANPKPVHAAERDDKGKQWP